MTKEQRIEKLDVTVEVRVHGVTPRDRDPTGEHNI